MGIPINYQCLRCHIDRNLSKVGKLGDEQTANAFAKDLLEIFHQAPDNLSSPHLALMINQLYLRYYGLGMERYQKEKEESNRFVASRMASLYEKVEAQPDPVLAGLQFSILGNYLDFSALQDQVRFEKLDEMMEEALNMPLDMDMYQRFCVDLCMKKKLLYITDNAGEIGFDQVFARQIARRYPHLEITFMVRGAVTQNDATREDALALGVDFPVIDNGNAVAGTEISLLSPEAKKALEEADVVLAKGMGNIETMYGCGYNVYYAFLVKCQRLETFFQKPLMSPMFIHDRYRPDCFYPPVVIE